MQKSFSIPNFSKLWCLSTVLILLLSLTSVSGAQEEQLSGPRPLMRFPDINQDLIVFVYAEDIWSVPSDGGIATRLTIHDGEERFPKISPDGSLIAFTGEYDGNPDVYVMNIFGGDIARVTFHPGYDEVVGWHPVSNKILFRSSRHSYSRFDRLYLISPDGTDLEELILNEAVQGSFSPDGKKIAYNKVPRESRTWKRYKGGTAQEIYLYDLETDQEQNLTKFEGTDRIPMWIGDKVYFSSDRDGILNVYSYDISTEKIEQLTDHIEYDVRRPSSGGNKIVYEMGGSLWILDVGTKEYHQLSVEIRSDVPEVRPYLKKVDDHITGFNISPSGQRALVVARGEIFTVPKEVGPIRNLTRDSGSRDKDAVWSPDGKKIAYLSDKSGEYEIYIMDMHGSEQSIKLTQHEDGYRHSLRWSPDSQKIAFADQTLRCYYLDINTKKITEVDKAYFENVDVSIDLKPIYDFVWSPDSQFIAYSMMDEDQVYKVYIYSLASGEKHCVSQGIFNDFNPLFSQDGHYLFFISNRHFDPTLCDFEWEMVYKQVAGIYCLTLSKDSPRLLEFKSDEVKPENDKDMAKPGSKEKQVEVRIDFDRLADRIEALPLARGNYRSLSTNDTTLFYLNADEGDYNRFEFRPKGPRTLYAFSFEDRKESVVIKNIDDYALSSDGAFIIYGRRNALGIIASLERDSKGNPLDLSDLKMWIDPIKEWTQIFNEAWRMERDFYYEPDMHGIDWDAMKEKYGRLVPHASCRQDIQYIIGELIGELSTSHTYVFGGERTRQAESVNVGMLGADFEIDKTNGLYRFKKIFRVSDWSRNIYPPLALAGMDIKEGDYLLQVNGIDITAAKNIYSYFLDLAGNQVTLTINGRPSLEGAKWIVTKPLGGEYMLRYQDWLEHNRKTVEEASGGQIGYIHLPDTYLGSATEFPKYFYSQLRKKGLIIDGRFNGGGLDPDIFLRRLDKPLHAYWTRRYSHDQTIPDFVTRAHMVCLTNRQAGSGGDMLPMEFQKRNMGPVIGTRTWGGLVGVSMWISLIDGGGLSAPDYRIYDTNGEWIVENEGVVPDIIVDLHPAEVARGYDAQLMKAVEELMKMIKEDPIIWPEHEPFPKHKRKYSE